MKRILVAALFVLFFSFSVYAQNTNVSATVTDAGGQAWFNGTYSFDFIPAPRFNGTYKKNGVPFTPTSVTGSLDATGTFTNVVVTDNAFITPGGTQWAVTVCPAASGSCFTSAPITITGASQTITSSLIPPAILISCGPGITAYLDSEVRCGVGGHYYNLVSQSDKICTAATAGSCTAWTSGGVSANSTAVPGILASASPYNAKFDGRSSQDGVLNGTTLVTSATLSCTASDINKLIFTVNSGTLSKANSTVASCSGANFVMNAAATASESGSNLVICSDDTTALTNAWNAALAASLPLYLPSGLACISSRPFLIPAVPSPAYPPQQAFVIKGAGLNATYVGMIPSFSFTETIGTVFENLWAQDCTYSTSALKGFNVVTTEDWSVTGFNFNFPSWPATHTVFYNVCQFRRMGIFNLRSNNTVGLTDTVQEVAVTDNNLQGIGDGTAAGNGVVISMTGGGGGDTFLGNIIAFAGTAYKFAGAQTCIAGCSIIGGLITGNFIDIDIQNAAVMEIADVDVTTSGSGSIGIKVGATATANLGRVLLTGANTGATGISIVAGGKVRSQQLDYQVAAGTPTEINNAGLFFDGYGNNLSGTITNTGTWYGAGSITGVKAAAGNLVLSAGWGASAAWTALTGATRFIQGTITNTGAGQAANPTITYTFPTPFPTVDGVVCRAYQVGGTQTILAATEFLTPSSLTATSVVFTYNGTPTVNLTEVIQIDCDNK